VPPCVADRGTAEWRERGRENCVGGRLPVRLELVEKVDRRGRELVICAVVDHDVCVALHDGSGGDVLGSNLGRVERRDCIN
jgi:hypothetical protein